MSKAVIELITNVVGIIRVGKDNFKHGDSYHWVATIIKIDDETVEVAGTLSGPSKEDWIAVTKEVDRLGYKKILVVRIKNDKRIEKFFDVKTGTKIKKGAI